MNRMQSLVAVLVTGFFCAGAGNTPAQAASPAKPAPAMERTEHEWKSDGQSSTFDAHWMGSELKMLREEMNESAGMIEKNEYFFNAGALLHYKQDRYPAPGKSGATVAIMASFDKSGKPVMSMKRVDGKPAGPASPGDLAQAKKHLAELLAIVTKARR